MRKSIVETHPHIAAEWHKIKNVGLDPIYFTSGSDRKVWWEKDYYDKRTGRTVHCEWQSSIYHRTHDNAGPFISLELLYPEVSKEWHPTKNLPLVSSEISYASGKKVWWQITHWDPVTKKTFTFEWQAAVHHRTLRGDGCPYLSDRLCYPSFNDLETHYPALAKQWNYEKNGDLLPSNVTKHSNKKVWWIYPYDDPFTGKSFVFEWEAQISARTKNPGCPFTSNQRLWSGYNDFATKRPDLLEQWDFEKNEGLDPTKLMPNSRQLVWWKYPYDDPETERSFTFSWQESITNRNNNSGCPFTCHQRVWPDYNDLKSNYPEVAREYNIEKNLIPPNQVAKKSNRKFWWKCPYCGKESFGTVAHRIKMNICECRQNY